MLVDGDSWQVGVFRQADAAMYEAKAAGRNAIRFFGADATSGSERQSAS
jgi:predicted signal transduction protein with EAL and GGDEF domain